MSVLGTVELGNNPKILICDDDENLAAIVVEWLGTIGYEGTHVTRPDQVIPLLMKEQFELLLLDYKMPAASGKEVLYHVRKIFNPIELPVVFLTAFGERDIVVDVAKLGISGFFVKPMNFEAMADKIPALKSIRFSLQDIRGLMRSSHLPDDSLKKEPGLDHLHAPTKRLYSIVHGNQKIVLFNSNESLHLIKEAKWTDQEITEGISIFAKLNSTWHKCWPSFWDMKDSAEKIKEIALPKEEEDSQEILSLD